MTSAHPALQFRLLGPVSVLAGDRELRLGGHRQCVLLTLLLLDARQVVPVERIVDELWPDSPPAGATRTVRTYVSRLRTTLGAGRLRAGSGGYCLDVPDEDVDARRFERLAAQGRDLLGAGSAGLAAERLHAALALWRGRALADVAERGALAAEARRLDELRLVGLEDRIEADLALGREAALVAELRTLVDETPLRERLWAQLALALYRCGRQGEALECLRTVRGLLDRELGVPPGAQLRELEVAILRQQVPSAAAPGPSRPARPAAPTSFVGRESELAALERTLREHRLSTVTGLGGVGKTRLASELARRQDRTWRDGVCLVELAGLSDAALVADAVAAALGLGDRAGERPLDAVIGYLDRRELLLVLDNCEHLAGACAELAEPLLDRCPNVRIIATSRMPLAVPGEVDFLLDPLPTPEEGADRAAIASAPAVQLFLQRAAAVSRDVADHEPALDAVSRICRELDGLPLAIELAAARAKSLSAGEIADRLGDRFRFLRAWRRVRDPRHQTLATAMDWSYDLLEADEAVLLARLSVFAGGAVLEAIAEVCVSGDLDGADRLTGRLVDASLIRAQTGEPTRYRLLETVRRYAAGKLADDPAAGAIHRAHAEHFLRLARSANLSIEALGHGPQRPEVVLGEQHNLRSAIDWATDADHGLAAELLLALENFWVTQAVAEGERRLARLLEQAPELDPLVRARVARDHAGALDVLGDRDGSRAGYLDSRALFAAAGDACGVAYIDFRLGLLAMIHQDLAEARELWQRSLPVFRAHDDAVGELQVLGALGELEFLFGDREAGTGLLETSITMAEGIGWWWFAAGFTSAFAQVAAEEGQGEVARSRGRQMLRLADRAGDRQLTLHALAILARAAALLGEGERALTLWSTVAATEDGPGRFGRFDRAEFAASMPAGTLPVPLPLDSAVALVLDA